VSSNGPWGDTLKNKAVSTFRYSFANINGLPAAAHKEKHDRITTSLEKTKIDMLGMAEININFKQTGPTNQWKDRFKKLRTNSHCSTNIHTTSTETQVYGGTAYLTAK
jgi:predicted extracellular nuclease